jgi:hypothetical protein
MLKKQPGPTRIGWDWREQPTAEQLNEALNPFGVHVYEDPIAQGSDAVAFIFTQGAKSKRAVRQIAKKIWGL